MMVGRHLLGLRHRSQLRRCVCGGVQESCYATKLFQTGCKDGATFRTGHPLALALVLHGRREERVRCRTEERLGVDFILPGVHGHPPAQHLHRIGAQAVGQRDARSRLWGYRGGLRAEHLQELMLDSRKKCDIEKVEHVLHAAMQVA